MKVYSEFYKKLIEVIKMSLFRNKKRNEFYNDLIKVNFKDIKVDKSNINIKSVLDQIKEETEKISKAIKNWRKNKTHTDTTDNQGTYSKSKSQNYLNDIKNACEEIEKINFTSDASAKNKVKPVGLTKINEIDTILIKPILTLQTKLKNAATARFSLFTFGAVLDDKNNKKRLAEISKDIEKLWNKLKKAKEKIEEKKSKIVIGSYRKKDPEIFKGLPNRGNYCFLNSALQQLYAMENFRNKVLKFDTDNLDTENKDNKKLIAVKKIFKHLNNETNLSINELNDLRKDLGYKGIQEDSGEHMVNIQNACKFAFKNNKSKPSHNNSIEGFEYITGFNVLDPEKSVQESIEDFLKEIAEHQRIVYLKIKNDKLFHVLIPNRPNKRDVSTNIKEKMTFKNVNDNLYVVNNFKDKNPRYLESFNCNLVGVTIHQGSSTDSGHYYVYQKKGSSWMEFNDNTITPRKWNDISKDISCNSTVLIYKLLN